MADVRWEATSGAPESLKGDSVVDEAEAVLLVVEHVTEGGQHPFQREVSIAV
jgi:hypothetical protein